MTPFVYIVHSKLGTGKLNKLLKGGGINKVIGDKGEREGATILDTFDNSLLKKSLLLVRFEDRLMLLDLACGKHYEQQVSGDWKFAADLKQGDVADLLVSFTRLRAFLPTAEVSVRQASGALIDDERKTRARYIQTVISRNGDSVAVGTAVPLRGYAKAYDELVQLLQKAGAVALTDPFTIYKKMGVKRCEYDPKPQLKLNAESPASKAATTIIRAFIDVARANEAGVIADYDTEFLHDYRVGFRKVRSVLSLFKGVYETEKTAELKTEFAAIMQGTNRLRDLDVYLMEKDTYFTMVPEVSQAGVTLLFDYLAAERKKELAAVTKTLRSKSYVKKIKALTRLFDHEDLLPAGPKGDLPAKVFASKLVLKRYGQVCRIAGTIDDDTEDEVVHQLRITCKKLRYLMEFFTPLFAKEDIRKLIKNLKIMQDNLGRFNDYSVQQTFLRQILEQELDMFKGNEMLITEAIGALSAMLYRLQLKERRQVMKNFARFNSDETKALFEKLFQGRGEK